jgi:hypothetical protein
MLTTASMIRIETYGNLMVDVQTGSEKLKDRAAHHRDRHGARLRGCRTSCCDAPTEREAAIAQCAGLTYTRRSPGFATRTTSWRSDRRGRRGPTKELLKVG